MVVVISFNTEHGDDFDTMETSQKREIESTETSLLQIIAAADGCERAAVGGQRSRNAETQHFVMLIVVAVKISARFNLRKRSTHGVRRSGGIRSVVNIREHKRHVVDRLVGYGNIPAVEPLGVDSGFADVSAVADGIRNFAVLIAERD